VLKHQVMMTIVSFRLDNEFKKTFGCSCESLCDKEAHQAYPVSLRDDFISNSLYFFKFENENFLAISHLFYLHKSCPGNRTMHR